VVSVFSFLLWLTDESGSLVWLAASSQWYAGVVSVNKNTFICGLVECSPLLVDEKVKQNRVWTTFYTIWLDNICAQLSYRDNRYCKSSRSGGLSQCEGSPKMCGRVSGQERLRLVWQEIIGDVVIWLVEPYWRLRWLEPIICLFLHLWYLELK
jgi:hypothetical protein